MEFKEGDHVEVIANTSGAEEYNDHIGAYGVVTKESSGSWPIVVTMDDDDLVTVGWKAEELILIGEENMSTTVTAKELRDLKLTDSERTLREAGFKDETGAWTDAGKTALLDKVAVEKEDELVKDIQAVKKAKETK
jgi:hypothetical protein